MILAPYLRSASVSRALSGLLLAGLPLVSLAAPPVVPGDFRSEVYSSSAAELFWNRSTNVPVAGYEITRNGEVLGVFDSLSYFDDTLERSVDYHYTVTAVGTNGERSGTSMISVRTPRSANDIAALQREIARLGQKIEDLEALPESTFRSPVPKTGQHLSTRQGDDGSLQIGVPVPDPRFTLNVGTADDLNENGVCDAGEACDGSVTDNLTGLVWLQNANCYGELAWSDAIDASRALGGDGTSACGLTDGSEAGDWRLPNIKEMQSLLDYGASFPDPLLTPGHPFVDVQVAGITSPPARYWTSTSIGGDGTGVYSLSIAVGWVERLSTLGTNFTEFTLPVRGGQ